MTEEKITRKPHRKLVAIDVDGVLNSYVSGWTAADHMPDAPNPGAMAFLKSLVEDGRFEVVVVSSRLNHPNGEDAVKVWLWNGLYRELGDRDAEATLKKIRFAVERPPAFVTIDDRAVTFLGTWPSLDRLASFQPFYKKPHHLRADPETAVAQVDALMMRIGRVASEVGCPDGVPALDWLEEMAESGHRILTMAPVTIERLSEDDLTRIRATPVRPGASIAMPPSYTLAGAVAKAIDDLLQDETAAHTYRTEPGYRCALDQLRHSVGVKFGGERPTVDGVPLLTAEETVDLFAKAIGVIRGGAADLQKRIDEIAPGKVDVMAAIKSALQGLASEPKKPFSLDREFEPYAAIEAIIAAAVPPGTPVTRASAGGDLGWRVGHGWLSVEGSDPSRPDQIRDFARSLAAIPDPLAANSRNGDSEIVRKTLEAGRAM